MNKSEGGGNRHKNLRLSLNDERKNFISINNLKTIFQEYNNQSIINNRECRGD